MAATKDFRLLHMECDPEDGVKVHGVEGVTANKLFRVPVVLDSRYYFGAEVLNIPSGVSFPPHIHEGHHLLYCTFGRGTVTFEEQQLQVFPGELIYVPGLVPHAVGATLGDSFRLLAIGVPHNPADSKKRMQLIDVKLFAEE